MKYTTLENNHLYVADFRISYFDLLPSGFSAFLNLMVIITGNIRNFVILLSGCRATNFHMHEC